MSSHHFVKEGQEPALIIANGASCSDALLFQLLEWSPYTAVLDGALERVLSKGIKFDLLIGDFDSSGTLHLELEAHQPLEIVHAEDQNKTDLEKALDFILEVKGFHEVTIVWAGGKRSDHTLNNLFTVARYASKMKLVILDDHTRAFVLPKIFIKHYPKGQILSLIPLNECTGIVTKNLLYPLNFEVLDPLIRTGSSNEVLETGMVHITHEHGALMLMEAFE